MTIEVGPMSEHPQTMHEDKDCLGHPKVRTPSRLGGICGRVSPRHCWSPQRKHGSSHAYGSLCQLTQNRDPRERAGGHAALALSHV